MSETQKITWFYGIVILFIALLMLALKQGQDWMMFSGFGLLFFILSIFEYNKVLLFIAFITPLSIKIFLADNLGSKMPVEPLMMLLTGGFLLKLLVDKNYDTKILKHPVTLFILLYLLWMLITTMTSEIPFISFKNFIFTLLIVVTFYFITSVLFKEFKNIGSFVWMYVTGLCIAVVYILYQHSAYGFSQPSSYYITKPFFVDHTVYAASIAFFIPLVLVWAYEKDLYKTNLMRCIAACVAVLLLVAMLYSYTRAAWLSLAGALGLYIILKLRIRFSTMVIMTFIACGIAYGFKDNILARLKQNQTVSSQDVSQHLKSVSNVSNDDSNKERINRWASAYRMFKDKPWIGFGPNTYTFLYAPYQRSHQMTAISTNKGDVGGVHNEYLQQLIGSGLVGLFLFLGIIITVIYRSMRLYYTTTNKRVKYLCMAVLIGLFTYVVHGMVNNYLDQDKVSIPFWAFISILVSLDVYHSQRPNPTSSEVLES